MFFLHVPTCGLYIEEL